MYVLGNPVRYTDPSGRTTCDADGYCGYRPSADSVAASFGVKFENGSRTWTIREKLIALTAVVDVARSLGARAGDTAINTFHKVFNTSSVPMVFLRGNKGSQFTNDGSGFDENGKANYCQIGSGGCTVGYTRYENTGQQVNLIKFETLSPVFLRARNNVVHELGHAFYNELGKPELNSLGAFSRDALIRNKTVGGKEVLEWEQHPHAGSGELFADTFLAWTYNAWNPNPPNTNPLAVDNAKDAMDNALALVLKP